MAYDQLDQGTSSLHAFFECGGLKSHHFECGKDFTTNRRISCAKCISNSIAANKPPLALCQEADMYAQMDNGTFFPQIQLLNEFNVGYPKATFFLTFRNISKWFHSLSHWPPRPRGPHMDERLRKLNLTGFPSGMGRNEEEFTQWYCNHVLRVRELVDNSDHHLIEVDIEDTTIARRMSEMFNISEGCWGHANVNLNIHPDVNMSEVSASKRLANKLKTKHETNEDGEKTEDLNVGASYIANSDNEQFDDEKDGSCFQARNNTVSPSMYQMLPKPYINLGFPKMGTTSLNAFFKCGGLVSHHYLCGRQLHCAACMKQSIDMGKPPFSHCEDGDAWTQLDDGRYFPQVELLEEIVKGYHQATFILMFRSMDKWYNSMSNWPPNQTKYQPLTKRLLRSNIPGLPQIKGNDVSVFSDWHCNHVKRVRDVIAKYPAHSLVEVNIEDPNAGEYLERVFGINQRCFGKKNVNIQ